MPREDDTTSASLAVTLPYTSREIRRSHQLQRHSLRRSDTRMETLQVSWRVSFLLVRASCNFIELGTANETLKLSSQILCRCFIVALVGCSTHSWADPG